MKIQRLIVVLFLMSNLVNALDFGYSIFTIESVMLSTAGLHVHLSPKPDRCTGHFWGNNFLISKETANYDAMSAAMLSAFLSNKTINVVGYRVVGNGTCSCDNWLIMTNFQIRK